MSEGMYLSEQYYQTTDELIERMRVNWVAAKKEERRQMGRRLRMVRHPNGYPLILKKRNYKFG